MKIGFIGFGEVSYHLSRLLSNEEILTSSKNRSKRTIRRINKSNVEVLDDFYEVAEKSDILISANSPQKALPIACKYANIGHNIYLDLNNINPHTALKISCIAGRFVDSSIIGNIKHEPVLYLSGKYCDDLKFLDEYIPIRIISYKLGDASLLKMLRSIYTKTLAAALIETTEIANSLNLKKELLKTLNFTEDENFINKSYSRINNTKKNSQRKKEELEEILKYFKDYDLTMSRATLDKISQYL